MSELKTQLGEDLKAAMKAKESTRLQTIRNIRGSVKNREIELGKELDDDEILRVIRSLSKQRKDSIEQYQEAGREDLVSQEQEELAVLEAYLPAAPDESAVEAMVQAVIQETGASSPKEMGKVMKLALERLGPAADGKQVSTVAKRLLSP